MPHGLLPSSSRAKKQGNKTYTRLLQRGAPFKILHVACYLTPPPPFCPNSSFHHAKPHQHQLQHHARRARARATHLVVVDVGPAHQCRQAPVDDVPAARPDEPISAASQWKRQLRESTPPTHTFFARSVLKGGPCSVMDREPSGGSLDCGLGWPGLGLLCLAWPGLARPDLALSSHLLSFVCVPFPLFLPLSFFFGLLTPPPPPFSPFFFSCLWFGARAGQVVP